MLCPGLQKSIDRREKILAVRNRDKVPDMINMVRVLMKMVTYPVWMVSTAFNHLAWEAFTIPLPLIYFCSTETRGTTASAGILFTVLSISSKSALSSTESSMRVSLLCSP